MRKLKFISVMMCCLAAMCFTFTSCDDDDDTVNRLTPEENQAAFNAVRGDYSGKMLYATTDAKTGKAKNDSVDIAWSIQSDTMMTVYQFPVALLAKNISDTTVSKAFAAEAPKNLNCYIGFIRVTPSTFLINPIPLEFNMTINGESHKIQIPFYVNNYYSYGQRNSNVVTLQIIAAAIYSDGKATSWLQNGVPYGFIANKK